MKSWVKVEEFTGGVAVFCGLCGRKRTNRVFRASDTNYSEMHRLATAYQWEHEHGEGHLAALDVYHHAEPPEITEQERLLAQVFGDKPAGERERRRQAARAAFKRHQRTSP